MNPRLLHGKTLQIEVRGRNPRGAKRTPPVLADEAFQRSRFGKEICRGAKHIERNFDRMEMAVGCGGGGDDSLLLGKISIEGDCSRRGREEHFHRHERGKDGLETPCQGGEGPIYVPSSLA